MLIFIKYLIQSGNYKFGSFRGKTKYDNNIQICISGFDFVLKFNTSENVHFRMLEKATHTLLRLHKLLKQFTFHCILYLQNVSI